MTFFAVSSFFTTLTATAALVDEEAERRNLALFDLLFFLVFLERYLLFLRRLELRKLRLLTAFFFTVLRPKRIPKRLRLGRFLAV